MQPTFTLPIVLGPTLAANHTFQFKAPFDMQLVAVSHVNSTANAGTLKIGTAADDDAYLEATSFGVSGTPVEVSRAGFVGGQFPHIPKGTTVVVTVVDHASHMAFADVVLTMTRG